MISKMKTSDRYFGYGSNLDWEDWEKFCKEGGKDPNSIEVLDGIYFLHDYELAFDYNSVRRGGGALDVVKKPGGIVPGKLFKVTEEGLNALDAKEGVKYGKYEQKTIQVLDEEGKSHTVITYVVTQENKKTEHQKPRKEYIDTIKRGYDKYGITKKCPWAVEQLNSFKTQD